MGRSAQPLFHRAMLVLCAAITLLLAGEGRATKITLDDGRVLEGRLATISGLAEDPLKTLNDNQAGDRRIVLLDDDLRRTYVPKTRVQAVDDAAPATTERIRIRQPVAQEGSRIGSAGPIIKVTPFDDFGRRTLTMRVGGRDLPVIQGITEITPLWTKVESLKETENTAYVWDMRIATSSIPRERLSAILAKYIDPKKAEQRLQLVRLLLQAERFQEAQAELEQIVAAFPDLKDLQGEVKTLKQLFARRLLTEIELRRNAGQFKFAHNLLKQFPTDDVSGEILQRVREQLEEMTKEVDGAAKVLSAFDTLLGEIQDKALRYRLETALSEIRKELSPETLPRMTAYRQLVDSPTLAPPQKLALAISGWLVGSDQANENVSVALSLFNVREGVREYLIEPVKLKREQILSGLRSQEGFSPALVSGILNHMKPANPMPEPIAEGFYKCKTPGLDKEPDIEYFVQLPPEYDPYRRYPTIVTLHGAVTTAEQQIDWWAGESVNGLRRGQAARHGYIVVAPAWGKPHQTDYEASQREHAAVLGALRDACRMFAVDTDRVFLSGHSMGGDAAWDMALSHPDLWAGVIPIVAQNEKTVAHYAHNAVNVPMYFVCGELDGKKMVTNSMNLDRYLEGFELKKFDVTVVEYLGRGHEHFSDEIQRLFDWMGRKERNFFPKQIDCATMRPGDNFFWWLEIAQFPTNWGTNGPARAMGVRGTITANNGINVTAGSAKVVLWLAPEMVDLSRPITIRVNNQRLKFGGPEIEVMLEDVRTRGDRHHPFWAKVE